MLTSDQDLDFSKLSKDQLKIYKFAFESYKQGMFDTGLIMKTSFDTIVKKTVQLYDEKIEEIDKLLAKDKFKDD